MDATAAYAIYGAGVSTVLGIVKLWETFWKDRLRLTTTYYLTGAEDEPHTITIVNLSGAAIQVAGWKLEWKPDRSCFTASTIDVTSDERSMFTIPPKAITRSTSQRWTNSIGVLRPPTIANFI